MVHLHRRNKVAFRSAKGWYAFTDEEALQAQSERRPKRVVPFASSIVFIDTEAG